MARFHLLTLACSANVFFTGLFAGALLFDRWGITPVRPTLPPDAFVRFQQGEHVNVMRLMPTLLILSIVSGATAAFLMRVNPLNFHFIFSVASTLLMSAILILTRAINVPINKTLMTWSAVNLPASYWQVWTRWEKAHTIRTVLGVLALLGSVVASRL